jgi:hypothetical protein
MRKSLQSASFDRPVGRDILARMRQGCGKGGTGCGRAVLRASELDQCSRVADVELAVFERRHANCDLPTTAVSA